MAQPLWRKTPLVYSQHISTLLDCDVYLKLENLQPSQSFKYRGISLLVAEAKNKSPDTHLIVPSGGNAGYATACAAKAIGLRCTVFLPADVKPQFLKYLKKEGAETVVGGGDYSQAFSKAEEAVAKDEKSIMVHGFDGATLWRGHGSLIEETAETLKVKPDAIFCSVGGGGLLGGVMTGCKVVGWDDVPIVALETSGADCFYHSMQANRQPHLPNATVPVFPAGVTVFYNDVHDVTLARLPAITSIAFSLAASSPSPSTVKTALQRQGGVRCVRVPDVLSMQTALTFAEDHKFLVELACSTTLVPAYKPALLEHIVPGRVDGKRRVLVFVVCGGAGISIDEMTGYRRDVDSQSGPWEVWCDGQLLEIEK